VLRAEDQDSFPIPLKPDGPRLRCVFRINGGEPDNFFFAQPAIDVPTKLAVKVQH
jgi:hypothetical protein